MTQFPEYVVVDYDEGANEALEDDPALEGNLGKPIVVTRTALE